MNILKEGVILIGEKGDVVVMDFSTDGTPEELQREVIRRLRLAAERNGVTAPTHNPASCACVSCAMLRLNLKAQIKAEMEAEHGSQSNAV